MIATCVNAVDFFDSIRGHVLGFAKFSSDFRFLDSRIHATFVQDAEAASTGAGRRFAVRSAIEQSVGRRSVVAPAVSAIAVPVIGANDAASGRDARTVTGWTLTALPFPSVDTDARAALAGSSASALDAVYLIVIFIDAFTYCV